MPPKKPAMIGPALSRRVEWTVYIEADNNAVFEDVVFAMDSVRAMGANVFWITPGMRKEWQTERPRYAPSLHGIDVR
jgi:hypothetical protein